MRQNSYLEYYYSQWFPAKDALCNAAVTQWSGTGGEWGPAQIQSVVSPRWGQASVDHLELATLDVRKKTTTGTFPSWILT